jgi:hypothetical protein
LTATTSAIGSGFLNREAQKDYSVVMDPGSDRVAVSEGSVLAGNFHCRSTSEYRTGSTLKRIPVFLTMPAGHNRANR